MAIEKIRNNVGKKITIRGEISRVPWQHLMKPTKEYPYAYYFDLPEDYQIVIYTKTELDERKYYGNEIAVSGEVIEVTGRSKRPRDEVETYTEYHINVDDIEFI
ncbi:MAG: hypothetical protein GF364_05605 [Candidatus Lokiarchaeota archaeon]|nr:hypothetical protein [Candidatus Lokiarchaeota archaeon]